MRKISRFLQVFIITSGLTVSGIAAYAQFQNRPFSFNTPDGGVGMSSAGKQALFNQGITGATPDNLLRGADGLLLSVQKGKGGVPLVSMESGGFIPSFRGSSFRGSHDDWAAGVFNTFFLPQKKSDYGIGYADVLTGAAISTWTGRVTSEVPVSFMPSNSIDIWTGMVIQPVHSYNE